MPIPGDRVPRQGDAGSRDEASVGGDASLGIGAGLRKTGVSPFYLLRRTRNGRVGVERAVFLLDIARLCLREKQPTLLAPPRPAHVLATAKWRNSR